jgi:hypothetical protein
VIALIAVVGYALGTPVRRREADVALEPAPAVSDVA